MNNSLPNNIKATIAEGANKGREVIIIGFDTNANKWKIDWDTGAVGWFKSNELVLQPGYEFSSDDKIVEASASDEKCEVYISQMTTGYYMIRLEDAASVKETHLTPEEFASFVTGLPAKDGQSNVSISLNRAGNYVIELNVGNEVKKVALSPAELSKAITGKFAKGWKQ